MTTGFAPVAAADVTVVICCYTEQRWADLLAAITSVRGAGQVVVVVDHNPTLEERLRTTLTGIDLVPNTEVQGLAGARNCGVAAARGRVIAFLDDDAVADAGWLVRLVDAYAAPSVLGVGGAALAAWPGPRPRWLPPEFDWVVGCSYQGQPTEVAAVRNFIGANMSLRREVFDAVGGFSHSLGRIGKHPAGCEETELCIRAGRAFPGTALLHDPSLVVHHRVTPERCRWRYFRRRCYAEGISKAVVAGLAGPDAALASERTYVRQALPAGVVRGLAAAIRGDGFGLARAAAIVAGLACTTAGYLRGRLAPAARRAAAPPPVRAAA
jgi:GT2 family glycosyltransferase